MPQDLLTVFCKVWSRGRTGNWPPKALARSLSQSSWARITRIDCPCCGWICFRSAPRVVGGAHRYRERERCSFWRNRNQSRRVLSSTGQRAAPDVVTAGPGRHRCCLEQEAHVDWPRVRGGILNGARGPMTTRETRARTIRHGKRHRSRSCSKCPQVRAYKSVFLGIHPHTRQRM